MATTRIKDLTTASTMADDDYIAIDGATNGTRKIAASDVGGGSDTWYDFMYGSSYSEFKANGTTGYGYMLYPVNESDVTLDNALKIKAYYATSSGIVYPLIITYALPDTSYITIWVKSIEKNVQSTTSTSLGAGAVHFYTPFEISRVSVAM